MQAESQPPFYGLPWDDSLEQTPAATREITRGQLRVEAWLADRAHTVPLTLKVVQGMHREIFSGVFPDFAGSLRGPAPRYIAQNVSFGHYRGTPYERVPDECADLCDTVCGFIRQIDHVRGSIDEASLDEEVLKAASYTHCRLIEIHPFVNGNGRLARKCINYFAWRYGKTTLPFARPNDPEYFRANKTWLQQRRIEHFMDFLRPRWQGG